MTSEAGYETFSFQAEVVQVLDLMINSLYQNKEIFLRELLSNASDALDRLRLAAFSEPDLIDGPDDLQITVGYNRDAGTITVADNGIGMSRQEVVDNLGTIARSGTREFLRSLTGDQRRDAVLIGKFGVGFYAAFVVAERVVLTTRRAGRPAGEAVHWESDGRGEYRLQPIERASRGTTIVLHLRDGEEDLLNDYRLRSIIKKYSDHISKPILMRAEAADAAQPADDVVVNQASALWTQPRNELTERDYRDFYRQLTADYADPLAYAHSKIEGVYEYTMLFYVPGRAPYDLWTRQPGQGVRLHVQRVFVMEDDGQLLPNYLRFVRGVIDSSDLPLNISREVLQGSRAVGHIKSHSVKRILRLLAELAAEEPEKYAVFWKEFGPILKEGVADDYSNRGELAKLLRFKSTKSAGDAEDVSLAGYVARMQEEQEKIYYLFVPAVNGIASSPHLEAYRAAGIEVLLLDHAVDGFVVGSLQEFDGKPLQSVAQGTPDLPSSNDEADQGEQENPDAQFAALLGLLKAVLADKVQDVRLTTRLTTSPSCIVANEPDVELNVARRLRGSGLPGQAVLELNPRHPLVSRLSDADLSSRLLTDWAHVLYHEAVLTYGARIDEPAEFVMRLNGLLVNLTEPDADADESPGDQAGKRSSS